MVLEVNRMGFEASNITVSLSNINIVNDISLRVKEGQFVGLIGPNGCGKSTLLKSIYKVVKPKQGKVYLNGMDLLNTDPKTVSRMMGVVGQFNEISFDFTVQEMVLMGRTPHKKFLEGDTEDDYEIVQRALDQVSLSGYETRSYSSLSGGEKQRVILARALAQQPTFLVMDEPTNHLDIKYQLQILSVVKKLSVGTLAALHDLELAADYCDYLYMVKQGSVVACGTPIEVLTKKRISDVYDVTCEVYTNPITGGLSIAYLSF
ncbi:ABC transporter ATP-binding protein [Anoxybacterium hadale]|uniref:ABC transporter ATP-binding protein n=1 Tax=Anoxybacterium hadale TaxID=3408580 RepID=A0ACD1AH32_9FIRM|nr:ABC transporter ATP-binding protein [Clostridiales bacterium]